MQCKLCDSKSYKKREGKVRDNKDLDILECKECGLVFLSQTKLKNNFYEKSNMHKTFDYEKWSKDTSFDDNRRFEFTKNTITNKKLLDFGSGNAGFLKLAKKQAGFICGVEIEDAVETYYKKEKIPLFKEINEINETFDVITSFHVLEHLNEPLLILKKLKDILNDKGKLIIEVPNANDALLTIYKNTSFSEFTYWSCHLYLYTSHTLSILAKQAGLKVDFLKYIQRYPLSNHLYWLSNNKPGGHVEWGNFIDSPQLTKAYEDQLASLQATDTIIAQFSKEV